jgi:hypothetical protein
MTSVNFFPVAAAGDGQNILPIDTAKEDLENGYTDDPVIIEFLYLYPEK